MEEKMLTDQQKKFIEVTKELELLKEKRKEIGSQLEELANQIGVGSSFQDPEDRTVFEIVVPEGRYMYFDKIDYVRTRREGERSGSLSLKRAKELGYEL
jgi:uncharacterized coiled-coil DUF342 family protein